MPRSLRTLRPPRAALLAMGLALGLIAAVAVLAPGVADALPIAPRHGGSPNADRIHALYFVVFGVGALIFVGVEGALFYALWKFRARPGAVAEQMHGNTRLEIGWTAGAAGIVLILGIVTFAMLPGIRKPDDSDARGWPVPASFTTAKDPSLLPRHGRSLNIDVNGQQYTWRFVYPDGDDNQQNNVYSYEQMVVPTGTTVTLDIRSSDVAHAWWIPELGGKHDALPGYTNHTWFKVPLGKEGIYKGQCAELCGRNHANMTAQVRAVTPAQFSAWLARQKQAIQQSGAADQTYRGQQRAQDQQQSRRSGPASQVPPGKASPSPSSSASQR